MDVAYPLMTPSLESRSTPAKVLSVFWEKGRCRMAIIMVRLFFLLLAAVFPTERSAFKSRPLTVVVSHGTISCCFGQRHDFLGHVQDAPRKLFFRSLLGLMI
jgi:hypothetical protein